MSLLAYCIVPEAAQPSAGLRGVGGAAVDVLTAAGLALWYSRVATRPDVSADTLRAHNRTVTAAMNTEVTPVPLRFGQWFEDETRAGAALEGGAERWTTLLRRFAGRAEYGVRISRRAASAAADSSSLSPEDPARDVHHPGMESGTAYMAAVAERHGTAKRVAAAVQQAAGHTIAEHRQEALRAEPGLATLAHLVAWSDADAYHACMQNVRGMYEDLDFLFTGPWPPYSFADEG
jgi:hypothetical protein